MTEPLPPPPPPLPQQRKNMSSGSIAYSRPVAVGTGSLHRSNGAIPWGTPVGSPKPKITSHTYRLYKAPQATIRGDNGGNSTSPNYDEPSSMGGGSTRGSTRRRRASAIESGAVLPMEQQSSSRSSANEGSEPRIAMPGAPILWGDECDSSHGVALQSNVPEMSSARSPLRPRRGLGLRACQMDDSSDRLDDDSNGGSRHYSTHTTTRTDFAPNENAPQPLRSLRAFATLTNLIQVGVLVILAVFIYDSHHKVKAHKVRLREYDEERAHVLEQMMWIDKAAKRVHNRYSTLLQKDPTLESRDELIEESKFLRDELEQVQLRIQLNARDRIHQLFGDKQLHVTLKLALQDKVTDVVLALSDDTPHAVATFLQQIDQGVWEDLVFETVEPGVVQITSRTPTSSPLLEFVERSRGCHEVGSVALRSTVNEDITMLVLRLNLIENAPLQDKDVCVGKLLQGVDALQEIL